MAIAAETLRPLTIDDLAGFPDDGMRREIITGELVETPVPTPAHQIIVGRLDRLIGRIVDEERLGILFLGPVDVRLTAHDVVEPDFVYVSKERTAVVLDRYIDGSPDLVVEVNSPSSRRLDRVRKMALYRNRGVREYWIVDPELKTVDVHTLIDGKFTLLPYDGGKARSRAIPGVEIDIPALFADMRWAE